MDLVEGRCCLASCSCKGPAPNRRWPGPVIGYWYSRSGRHRPRLYSTPRGPWVRLLRRQYRRSRGTIAQLYLVTSFSENHASLITGAFKQDISIVRGIKSSRIITSMIALQSLPTGLRLMMRHHPKYRLLNECVSKCKNKGTN